MEYDLIVPTELNKLYNSSLSYLVYFLLFLSKWPNETDMCEMHFYIYHFFPRFLFKLWLSLLLNMQNNERAESMKEQRAKKQKQKILQKKLQKSLH